MGGYSKDRTIIRYNWTEPSKMTREIGREQIKLLLHKAKIPESLMLGRNGVWFPEKKVRSNQKTFQFIKNGGSEKERRGGYYGNWK